MLVLGIETSCDETGLAVYDTKRGLLAHALHSQVAMHEAYGGVVPELASRATGFSARRRMMPRAKHSTRRRSCWAFPIPVDLRSRSWRSRGAKAQCRCRGR